MKKNKNTFKILHGMSDVAGQGSYSVKGLKSLGCDAKLFIWRKNPFNYSYDTCLNIGKKKLFYPYYLIKIGILALYSFIKFDVFHFHFANSLLPFGLDLPFVKMLKKPCFMEYHGSDIRWTYYREYPRYYPYKELPIKWKWAKKVNNKICKYVDGVILHDEELRKHLPKTASNIYLVPLRLDINNFTPVYPTHNNCPVIVHAPSNYIVKGSSYVVQAIGNLKKKYKFKFILVEGITQENAFKIYKTADIVIDQLFAGSYGVFALEAMALGKPVLTYIADEMENYFPDELPIINTNINNIEEKIEFLLKNPELCNKLGKEGRTYVENYHDCNKIAKMLYRIYQGTCPAMGQKEAFEYVKLISLEE